MRVSHEYRPSVEELSKFEVSAMVGKMSRLNDGSNFDEALQSYGDAHARDEEASRLRREVSTVEGIVETTMDAFNRFASGTFQVTGV